MAKKSKEPKVNPLTDTAKDIFDQSIKDGKVDQKTLLKKFQRRQTILIYWISFTLILRKQALN